MTAPDDFDDDSPPPDDGIPYPVDDEDAQRWVFDLAEQYYGLLLEITTGFFGTGDAPEMVDRALDRARKKWRLYRPKTCLRAWLTVLTRRVCIDEFRRRNRQSRQAVPAEPIDRHIIEPVIEEERRLREERDRLVNAYLLRVRRMMLWLIAAQAQKQEGAPMPFYRRLLAAVQVWSAEVETTTNDPTRYLSMSASGWRKPAAESIGITYASLRKRCSRVQRRLLEFYIVTDDRCIKCKQRITEICGLLAPPDDRENPDDGESQGYWEGLGDDGEPER